MMQNPEILPRILKTRGAKPSANSVMKKKPFQLSNQLELSSGLGRTYRQFPQRRKTVIEPKMTFHFMPALWFDDWGLEITENFVITKAGAETLANVPLKLFVKQ